MTLTSIFRALLRRPCALLLLSLAATAAHAQTIGQVRFVTGPAELVRGATRTPITRDLALQQADRIVTGADGHVQISLTDGSFVAVRPGSDFNFAEYSFNPNQPALGKALMSLVRGTVRVFTGDMVRANRSNFRMNTPITTVGIRGSGNILAHDDTSGTINHTLTGAHSVTSKDPAGIERTLVSYPGQTIQALPNQPPRFIPTPSFILAAASPGGKAEEKAAKDTQTGSGQSPEDATTATTDKAANSAVAAAQATTNTVGGAIVAAQPQNTNYNALVRFTNAISGGFESGLTQTAGTNGGAIIDAQGRLVGMRNARYSTFISANGGNTVPLLNPTLPAGYGTTDYEGTTVTISGGTHHDGFRTPDGSVIIGRWQGGTLSATGGTAGVPNSSGLASPFNVALGPRSLVYTVTNATPFSVIASATGTINFSLVAATAPTDVAGNVGTLTNASASANFTNLTITGQFGLQLNGATISVAGNSAISAFDGGSFNFINLPNQGTTVTCSGATCASGGYRTTVNGQFNGADGRWMTMIYRINPNRTIAGSSYSDAINGSIVLGSGSALAPAFSLPMTGSVSLNFNNPASPTGFTLIGNNQVAVSHVAGTLQANFSNSTLAFNATVAAQAGSFGNAISGPTYTISGSNVPIVRNVATAIAGPPGVANNAGTMNISCSGTLCVQNPQGRFDAIFRNASGTSGSANIGVGQYFVQTTFGTPPTPMNIVTVDASRGNFALGGATPALLTGGAISHRVRASQGPRTGTL
ncbi:MAG: FecR domain-containing protein [Betaproteobacteria bacterium]|nr:FecR domain-containing protein [Betaproteobacteria bacterium]